MFIVGRGVLKQAPVVDFDVNRIASAVFWSGPSQNGEPVDVLKAVGDEKRPKHLSHMQWIHRSSPIKWTASAAYVALRIIGDIVSADWRIRTMWSPIGAIKANLEQPQRRKAPFWNFETS